MTDSIDTAAAPPRPKPRRAGVRRRAVRAAADGAAFSLTLLAVVGFLAFAARADLARQAAQDVLAGRGVEADFELRTLTSQGLSGRLRIGPADDPDLLVENLELAGDLSSPWAGGAFGFQPTAIRMTRPYLRVRFDGQRLSYGRLDPLIDEALRRPESDGPSPAILLQDATVLLITPAGRVRLAADAGLADDRLLWLDARAARTTLEGESGRLRLASAAASVRTRGERSVVRARVVAEGLSWGATAAEGAVLRLTGEVPYPDTRALELHGPVALNATMTAATAEVDDRRLRAPWLALRLAGQADGGLETLAFGGEAWATLRAAALDAAGVRGRALQVSGRLAGGRLRRRGGAADVSGSLTADASLAELATAAFRAGGVRATLRSPDFRWAGAAPTGALNARVAAGALDSAGVSARSVSADVATRWAVLNAAAAPLRASLYVGDLRATADAPTLQGVALRLDGRAQLGDAPSFDGFGSLSGRSRLGAGRAGTLAAAVPILGGEPAYREALAVALADARLTAPALDLRADTDGLVLALGEPARVQAANGVRLTVRPQGAPLLRVRNGAGTLAFEADVAGAGLPSMSLASGGLNVRSGGVAGPVRLAVRGLDFGPAQGVVFTAQGSARFADGAFAFAQAGCLAAQVERVELGANDLTGVVARLCPDGPPMVTADAGGWRFSARAEAAALAAPELNLAVRDGAARLRLRGDASGVDGTVAVTQAVLRDTAEPVRFEPLGLTLDLAARDNAWTGSGRLRARGQTEVATLAVALNTDTGAGGLAIDAPSLRFATDGLQPADLSPLAGGLMRAASGEAAFRGRLDWTRAGVTSGGVLTARALDFGSPLGRVDDLNGAITLTSLAPVVSAPDQRLTARAVASLVPLTDVALRLQVVDEAVRVSGGTLSAGGGRVTVEPTVVPFGEGAVTGSVRLAGVNVGAVFESTDLADRVRIDAPVSGPVPFTWEAGRLRLPGAQLTSDRAGRIAIARTALSGLEAEGAAPAEAAGEVNAVQDFAYQALENLAYDDLSLALSTSDDGRLRMRFIVQGRHDPPERRQAFVPLFDLLRGSAFRRRIPLPSDTGVNLTLDTSLNLDDLLAAWAQLQGAGRRSVPVQPPPPRSTPGSPEGAPS